MTDFGLAKQFEVTPDETGLGQQTESGALLGTPNYMALEQASGSKGVGPPADVYALGAILYECLTGRPPFRAATVLETLEQVRSQEPVQPARLQPRLPRDLQTITLKCLEKEPSRRYPSARDLADDLGRYLRGEPIQARPASVRERLSKWVRRRPALASLVAVSTLSLATFVIGVLVYDARLRGTLRQANDSANEAKEQRQRAETSYRQAREAINQMLAHANADRFPGVPAVRQVGQELQEDALAFFQGIVREADNPDPQVRDDVATAYKKAADIQFTLGRGDRGEESYGHARDLLEALVDRFPDNEEYCYQLASCYGNLALVIGMRGNAGDSETLMRKALDVFEKLAVRHPDVFIYNHGWAAACTNLGRSCFGSGRPDDAAEYWSKVPAI